MLRARILENKLSSLYPGVGPDKRAQLVEQIGRGLVEVVLGSTMDLFGGFLQEPGGMGTAATFSKAVDKFGAWINASPSPNHMNPILALVCAVTAIVLSNCVGPVASPHVGAASGAAGGAAIGGASNTARDQ